MKKLTYLLLVLASIVSLPAKAFNSQKFSTAGFYSISNSPRHVYDMNAHWRFYKGDIENAQSDRFDDSTWSVVNIPNDIEDVPKIASGSLNYQGIVWYRKHFLVPDSLEGKRLNLYFEGVMGKSEIYINGELVAKFYGGYLPISVDIEKWINIGGNNVIAVKADNSNDPMYPPGKPQEMLDFTYFGGIYRDVFLVTTEKIFLSDPNQESEIAGGGVSVYNKSFSTNKVVLGINTSIRNEIAKNQKGNLCLILTDAQGKEITQVTSSLFLKKKSLSHSQNFMNVVNPHLWSPKDPYLYWLQIVVKDNKGTIIDSYKKHIGIRKIEFRGKDGFWLNDKPYKGKLIGGNRHQDYAVIGNALSNELHFRDVKSLRDAGMTIIRSAHYPQDPAFLDACDQLGMFLTVATPGWQFWNKEPIFEKRVQHDVRNMVRRDRNHPSVLLWEPILNETWYPDYFAQNVHNWVHQEYPWGGAYTVCDSNAKGANAFDVWYSHPFSANTANNHYSYDGKGTWGDKMYDYDSEKRCIFTREWGDCVDDWSSHNSPGRAAIDWGEIPMLVQAKHYSNPDYLFTDYETLYETPRQHVGGALWHPFDHQRGYHPDTFYGGIMDAFRLPKYSYYMFQSQRDPHEELTNADSGPMLFIANQMTPFSPKDITVFTNCDSVKLIVYGKKEVVKEPNKDKYSMPHPPIVFDNIYEFMDIKALFRHNKADEASIKAVGYLDGEAVIESVKKPSKRVSAIRLRVAGDRRDLIADGSDQITLVAEMVDQDGIVKRLNNMYVKFTIEGEGHLVDHAAGLNPYKIEWGEAPIIVRSTTSSGNITVRASVVCSGKNTPISGKLVLHSKPSYLPMLFEESIHVQQNTTNSNEKEIQKLRQKLEEVQSELSVFKLKEVEKQQSEFEHGEEVK